MRHVLYRVTMPRRIARAKVEGAEIHRLVRAFIDDMERNSDKASLHRLTPPEDVHVDGSVSELVTIEPDDPHPRPFADLEGVPSFLVGDGHRPSHDFPPRVLADCCDIESLCRLRV